MVVVVVVGMTMRFLLRVWRVLGSEAYTMEIKGCIFWDTRYYMKKKTGMDSKMYLVVTGSCVVISMSCVLSLSRSRGVTAPLFGGMFL